LKNKIEEQDKEVADQKAAFGAVELNLLNKIAIAKEAVLAS